MHKCLGANLCLPAPAHLPILSQGACRDFTDSLVGMAPGDMARVARDPAGARALEALLDGNAPTKVCSFDITDYASCKDHTVSVPTGIAIEWVC